MEKSLLISRIAEMSSAILLAAAFALIQALIGGTRLLFSLPAYSLLAAIGFLSLFSLRRIKPEPDQLCLWSAAAFFAYILARAFLSPVPYFARADVYSVLGGLLVYLFVACVLVNTRARMFILLFLLVAALAHVFIGAIQFRDGNNFMPISFLRRFDYGQRASGFYVCPNHLAGLLEVVGIFGLSIVCWSRWPAWAKLLVGYTVAVSYAGLVLTGSRGGYLSAAGSLALFAAVSLLLLRRADAALFWKVGGAGVIGASVVAAALVFFVQKSDLLSGRAQNVSDNSNIRVDLWQAALQQWKVQPFVGTGAGTYLFYGRQFRTDRMQRDPVEVHNDYLHLLAEYGALGAFGFLVFLAFHCRRGWKSFQRLGPKRVAVSALLPSNTMALNIGALCSIAAYAIHSVFDFNLHIPANVLLFAFVFGVIANPGIQRGDKPKRVPTWALSWRLLLPALGIVLAVQCVRLLPGEYFAERARTALRDFHPAGSILFALRGLSHERQNPDLYNYLGRARLAQGSLMSNSLARKSLYQAALDAFWKGRSLAPRDENFALELGYTYDVLERFPEAEWMFAEARALDPRSTTARQCYEAHLDRWRQTGAGAPRPE